MVNKLETLLEEIQIKHRLTLEQIAVRIGFSRPYLNKMKKEGGNDRIEKRLLEEFPDIVQNDTKGDTADDTRALIKDLQENNRLLREMVRTNLADLNAEIASNRELLTAILHTVTARSEVIMAFLEEQSKKKPGSLAEASDNLELSLARKHNQKGKSAVVGSSGKT